MHTYIKKYLPTILGCALSLCGYAQEDRSQHIHTSLQKGIEYEIKAGFNIVVTSPPPLPVDISKLNSYDLSLRRSDEINILQWCDHAL